MIIHVTRHGQTDFNVQGRYAGSTDVPLNSTGEEQAAELAQKLEGEIYDTILVSPMIRAQRTAEIVCAGLGMKFETRAWLAERHVGVYEGLTGDEIKERYPELWARYCTRALDDAPTGGETIRQVDKRISEGLESLYAEYPGKKVLLITHGFASRAINRVLMGETFEQMLKFMLGNCEVMKYEIEGK